MASRQKLSETEPRPGTARAAALALLGRRDYTAAELASRLTDKGYDPDTIAGALADLAARGLVDDARVAAAHTRTAAAVKGRGRVRIARELAARGVARNVIGETLATVARDDELASIRRILARRRWPAQPTRADRQRMYRHLLGRGFPADLISRALGRHVDIDDVE